MLKLTTEKETIVLEQTNEWHCLVIAKESHTSTVQLTYNVPANETLNVLFIQESTSEELHITQRGTVASGGTVNVFVYTLNSAKTTHNIHTELQGDHGTSNVYWQFYGQNNEQYVLEAVNTFNSTHGGGQMYLRGIAEDTAYITCNGLIEIGLQGAQTDTYLTEDVLMLDSTAKVDATPGLEIKTNDVKASHSATVSRITEEDLFYFEARGIPEAIARHMFIEGFLEADTEQLPEEGRELVKRAITSKLRPA